MTSPRISIIVAHSQNMAIGKANTLLWHLPDELKRFKRLTTGHPVIMGRRTWESIPDKFRPLPNRTNIVVTRNESYLANGANISHNLEDAIKTAGTASGKEEIFVIGGEDIYKQALNLADRLYVTIVDTEADGDAFFPEYSKVFTKKISEESGENDGLKYSCLVLEK